MENEELKMLRRILAEEEGKEEDILDSAVVDAYHLTLCNDPAAQMLVET